MQMEDMPAKNHVVCAREVKLETSNERRFFIHDLFPFCFTHFSYNVTYKVFLLAAYYFNSKRNFRNLGKKFTMNLS